MRAAQGSPTMRENDKWQAPPDLPDSGKPGKPSDPKTPIGQVDMKGGAADAVPLKGGPPPATEKETVSVTPSPDAKAGSFDPETEEDQPYEATVDPVTGFSSDGDPKKANMEGKIHSRKIDPKSRMTY